MVNRLGLLLVFCLLFLSCVSNSKERLFENLISINEPEELYSYNTFNDYSKDKNYAKLYMKGKKYLKTRLVPPGLTHSGKADRKTGTNLFTKK